MKKIIVTFALLIMTLTSVFAGTKLSNVVNSPINVSFIQLSRSAILEPVDVSKNIYKLTFMNVNPNVTYFSDRPNRLVGRMSNREFLVKWQEGNNSFNADAPNAVLSGFENKNHEFINIVLELTQPNFKAIQDNLSYQVHILKKSQKLPAETITLSDVILFIDGACLTCIG